jgi:hypothetical protein
MKKGIVLLIMATTGLISCGQEIKLKPDFVAKETLTSTENAQKEQPSNYFDEKYIDTRYEYTDSSGMGLIIQNSLPKGGLKYTDPSGTVYVYAIFWTRITNGTATPFEFTIDFPVDSYELPSAPGSSFKILLPSDTMMVEKEDLFNYGLTSLNSFLNNSISKPSSLKRTINPKQSSTFYVVTLFRERGIDGVLRTGLSLKEQDLLYRINDKEIQCGKINLKTLVLRNYINKSQRTTSVLQYGG